MLYDFIFVIGAVQSAFLAFVLWFKKNKSIGDKLLIAWLCFLAVHLIFIYFGFSGYYKAYPKLAIVGSSLMLLQGPFIYFYTAFATNKIRRFRIYHIVHIIPFLFFTCYFAHKILSFSAPDIYIETLEFFNDEANSLVLLFGLLNHFHIIIYLYLSMSIIRKHTKQLPETFSYTEGVNLKWLKNLIIGITVIAILIIAGLLIDDILSLVNHNFKATLIYSALAILPFYLSFYAIRQKIIYPEKTDDLHSSKYQSSGLSLEESKKRAIQLSEYMTAQKPYLNPKLTIKDLAASLEMHPKELSRVINENLNQNFFNFVNNYRVEEYKNQLTNPKNSNFTLIAIAYDCGFNTKSSFNSIFKKFTGKTPSQFRADLNSA